MEGGDLNERTLRRLPFVLAGACLAMGALGLAMTAGQRTLLVPFEPIDYSLMVQDSTPSGPTMSGAPGAALEQLQPEAQYVAVLTEKPSAVPDPVFTIPQANRTSPTSGGGPVAPVAVPVAPVAPPAEPPGTVLDSEPPPVPESSAAVPAAPSSNSKPAVSVVSASTGAALPMYSSRSANTVATPGPSQTNKPTATPTASPTQKATATPTATPSKPGNGKSNPNSNSNSNSNSKK